MTQSWCGYQNHPQYLIRLTLADADDRCWCHKADHHWRCQGCGSHPWDSCPVLDSETLASVLYASLMLCRARKSCKAVIQQGIRYGIFLVGCSNRCKLLPDSNWSAWSLMVIIYPQCLGWRCDSWSDEYDGSLAQHWDPKSQSAQVFRAKGNTMGKVLVDAQLIKDGQNQSALNLVQLQQIKGGHWKQVGHGGDISCTLMKNEGVHLHEIGCNKTSNIVLSLVPKKLSLFSKVTIGSEPPKHLKYVGLPTPPIDW